MVDSVIAALAAVGEVLLRTLLGDLSRLICDEAEPLRSQLSRDDLFVKHEDAVLGVSLYLVERLGSNSVCATAALRTVRIAFVSPRALAAMQRWLVASPHAHERFLPLFTEQLAVRKQRQNDPRLASQHWGCAAWFDAGKLRDSTNVPSLLRPRHAYAFTVDVSGISRLNSGAGIYFVWLDPRDPLGCNDPRGRPQTHGLPQRYEDHVQQWGGAYGVDATVLNGAQCWLAVNEAAMHPEFSRITSPLVNLGHAPLAAVYSQLAARGDWIQCVDIARVAVAWLAGGPSIYLDTDMQVGPSQLPSAFFRSHSVDCRMDASWSNDNGGESVLVTTPLLALAQDADGLVQNNFIAVAAGSGGSFHPFLTLILQSMVLGALEERHVLHATGPALWTALYYASRSMQVNTTPSHLLLMAGNTTAAREETVTDDAGIHSGLLFSRARRMWPLAAASVVLAELLAGDTSELAVVSNRLHVPTFDKLYVDTLARLPYSASDERFRFVARVAPLTATVGKTSISSHTEPPQSLRPGRRIYDLRMREMVHLCPPSAFYPRHWRDVDDAAVSGMLVDEETAAATHATATIPTHFGGAMHSSNGVSVSRYARGFVDGGSASDVVYGHHSWDCTWGNGTANNYYTAGYYLSAGIDDAEENVAVNSNVGHDSQASYVGVRASASLPRQHAVTYAAVHEAGELRLHDMLDRDTTCGEAKTHESRTAQDSSDRAIASPSMDWEAHSRMNNALQFAASSRAHDEFGIAALARRCSIRLMAMTVAVSAVRIDPSADVLV